MYRNRSQPIFLTQGKPGGKPGENRGQRPFFLGKPGENRGQRPFFLTREDLYGNI